MKINIFIPTIPKHFQYLDKICELYMSGVVIPHQIIISVGNYNTSHKVLFDNLEKKYQKLIVIREENHLFTAESCQKAKNYDADVVVFHGSDDYPHPQRVEIVQHYFDKYKELKHLHHSYTKIYKFGNINIDDIKEFDLSFVYNKYFAKGYDEGSKISKTLRPWDFLNELPKIPFTGGAAAYSMEVLENIQWDSFKFDFMYQTPTHRGQDYEYFMKSIQKYNNALFIDSPIYWYNV